jgi:hypothetical protein
MRHRLAGSSLLPRLYDAPTPWLADLPLEDGKHLYPAGLLGPYDPSTCVSAASACGSQKVIAMARYSAVAAESSVRARSR